MRSVDDAQLRGVLKDTYARMGKTPREGRIASVEQLAFRDAIIPEDAQVFFPPLNNDGDRSPDNAVIYLGDPGGSTIRVLPKGVRVDRRASNFYRGGKIPSRSNVGSMAYFV